MRVLPANSEGDRILDEVTRRWGMVQSYDFYNSSSEKQEDCFPLLTMQRFQADLRKLPVAGSAIKKAIVKNKTRDGSLPFRTPVL